MLEFRNDVLQRWMVNFANYSAAGFPNNDWTEYLERMIKSGDEKIQVIMKPPQNFIRGKSANIGGSNVVIQYDFDVGKWRSSRYVITMSISWFLICQNCFNIIPITLNIIIFDLLFISFIIS